MNWKHVWIIFTKEMSDTLRDRRTWFAMVIMPVLLVPVLMLATPIAVEKQFKKMEEVPPSVAMVGAENSNALVEFFKNSGRVAVTAFSGTAEDAEQQVKDGKFEVAVIVPSGFESSITAGGSGDIQVAFDASRQKSSMTQGRVSELLGAFNQQIVAGRLAAKGMDVTILTPIKPNVMNIAPEEQVGAFLLAMLMPMLLGVWASMGGMYAAIDAAAGEKERGTLEPLLAAPPSRLALVAGKYLTVVVASVASAALSMLGLMIALWIKPTALMGPQAVDQVRFAIPLTEGFLILLVAVSLAGLFSALELAISVFARSFKEAQTYLSPLSLAFVLPAIFTQFIEVRDISPTMFHIPILNSLFVFKELFYGIVNWNHLGTYFGWSVLYIVLALRLAASMFKREQVVFRG